jgi:hypothetical protein
MQQSQPDPVETCGCGRSRQQAVSSLYRASAAVFVFHRCLCGLEWTEQRPAVDAREPVSDDELIEVHVQLARFEGSIAELIQQPQT